MRLHFLVFTGFLCLILGQNAVGADKINVGIYTQGHGIKPLEKFLNGAGKFNTERFDRFFPEALKKYRVVIDKFLNRTGKFKAETFDRISPEALKKYRVVIFNNTTTIINPEDTRATATLLNYVHNGGGVMLTHNAAAFRGVFSRSPFPWIGFAKNRTEGRLVKGTEDGVAAISQETHPIARGVLKQFEHMYYDHIALVPGSLGVIVAVDRYGDPIMLAGEPFGANNGRVVMTGLMPGLVPGDHEDEPSGNEGALLISAIKWLAAGKSGDFSQKETAAKYASERRKLISDFELNAGKISFKDLAKCQFKHKVLYGPFELSLIMTPAAAKVFFQDIKSLGINIIMPAAIAKGEAFYPDSKVLPTNQLIQDTGIDYLALLCREGKKHNIAVYGAVEPFSESKHYGFLKENPDCQEITETEYSAGVKPTATSLCPDNPKVRKRILAAIKELLEKYPDMAGISLDFIRYRQPNGCFCPYSRKLHAEYAANNSKLTAAQAVSEFCENSIVSFLKDMRQAMDQVNKDTAIYAYTHPSYANKWPLDIHAKRASGASMTDSNFETPEQTYYAALNLVRSASQYYKNTEAAPLADLAFGKSVEQLRNEIRIIGKAGAKSIALWSYPAFYGANMAMPKDAHIKMISEEFGGNYQPRPDVQAGDMIPQIASRLNLVKGGAFEAGAKSGALTFSKVEFADGGPIGKKCAVIAIGSSLSSELYPVAPGDYYTISAYVNLPDAAAAKDFYVRLTFYDKNKKAVYVRMAKADVRTGWQRVWITRQSPYGNKAGAYVGGDIYYRGKGRVHTDGFKLEKGILPSIITE